MTFFKCCDCHYSFHKCTFSLKQRNKNKKKRRCKSCINAGRMTAILPVQNDEYKKLKSIGTNHIKLSGKQRIPCSENDSITLGCQPAAAKLDFGETFVDEGGCTATSLFAIGVFSSVNYAKQGLNNEIPLLLQKWKMVRREKNIHETKRNIPSAGISDRCWHSQTIQQAVIKKGWHFKLVPINTGQPPFVNLKETFKRGSYFVIGLTNNQWYNEKNKKHIKFRDWPVNGPTLDASDWVHAIAIMDGMVHDFETRTSISTLWLQSNNQPDHNKGYMHSIHKVWRVYRCNQEDTNCNGNCNIGTK